MFVWDLSTYLLSTTHFGYVSFHIHIIYVQINIYLFLSIPTYYEKAHVVYNLIMGKVIHIKILKWWWNIIGEYMMQHIMKLSCTLLNFITSWPCFVRLNVNMPLHPPWIAFIFHLKILWTLRILSLHNINFHIH